MIRAALNIIEIAVLSILVLTTRCANYQDVFVAGNVYFTDADCYARMTRVRMCSQHPGLILRHHDFENFPAGTTPHTTAPFDYLILALSIFLKLFTAHAIDLAGALISPLLALFGVWFLWWWPVKLRYRWVMLILYAISPILAHGTELGRPDHQSLLMLLITIAVCAEWSRAEAAESATNLVRWSLISGIAWGLAIWTSAYESLVLFLLAMIVNVIEKPRAISASSCRAGWFCFVLIIGIALLIEQHAPSFSGFYSNPLFQNWTRTIGELAHVSPANPIWLRWTGYLLLVTPLLNLDQRDQDKAQKQGNDSNICSGASGCNLRAHGLAGAVGLLLRLDLCSSAAAFARGDQTTDSSLDRVFFVTVPHSAGLG